MALLLLAMMMLLLSMMMIVVAVMVMVVPIAVANNSRGTSAVAANPVHVVPWVWTDGALPPGCDYP